MKIQIQKTIIENALAKSIPFLDTKDSSKVVSNVHILSKDSLVVVSASDYEVGISITLNDVVIINDGSAIANGKKLLDIIKILKNGIIDIELKSDVLHIQQGRSKFKIPVLKDTFPSFPSYVGAIKINIPTDSLIDALRKVTPTIDVNNPKYEFNGVLIQIAKNNVNFISTDTKRLSFLTIENHDDNEFSIIVSKRAVVEIQKLFFEDIEIYCTDTVLLIKSDRFSFFTKLINGKFPDVTRVIPTSSEHIIEIDKVLMIDHIKQITTMTSEIKISLNDNTVFLESMTNDVNEAKVDFDMESNISGPVTFCIQSKHMLDFLGVILSNKFTLKINDGNLPIVLESDDLKTIIMPIVS